MTGAPPRFAVSAAATDVVPAGPLVTTRLSLASNCEHKNRICNDKMSFAVKLVVVLLLARDVWLTRGLPRPFPPSAVPDPIPLALAVTAPVVFPAREMPLFAAPLVPAVLFVWGLVELIPGLPELLLSVLFVPLMLPGNPPVFMPVLPNPVPDVAPGAPAPAAAPAPVAAPAPPAPPVCAKAEAAKAMAAQAIAATSVFFSFAMRALCVPLGSTSDNGWPGDPFRGQAQTPPCYVSKSDQHGLDLR